ncbi:TetR/AcrR family transcriptional regulator [Lysinibacillus sp. SGAir0095]|uniref:TetR/AcrR family transcriptional regulator n=1 Tax=Lysinibacillus sp. SGAir0095 TaxID=2070463 RepID=UPI0010CCEF13|nr:TetR/AcrR family transcriptional regulator [Lysinibacillus sp. SGAir0095]QCR31474.1 TetR/AcrR family transcriptional regulator [Lysinibacillus sp. SGAir0095]
MARGRKVNSNGEKSKQLLREKAIELFSTNGYYQTKISDIVKAAQVTQPTFYLYFESKDSLFHDLHQQFQQDLFNILDEPFDQKDIQLLKAVEKLLQYFITNPMLTKIGLYQSEEAFLVKEKLVEKFEEILEGQINNYPNLQRNDIHIISQSFLGSILRLTDAFLLTNKKSAKELAEDLFSIYFKTEADLVTS